MKSNLDFSVRSGEASDPPRPSAYLIVASHIEYVVDRMSVGCDFLQSQCRLDKVKKIDPFSVIANRKMR